ncbi:hypothetical protein [Bacillus sp. M6-12]|uniref:hypothetical protein n=1 Tax=Bacillus sp. M6-12 TaxID=2054166 RepID=UPI0015E12BF4|nr:hypothetical protein [Bacillus sp. M6-12]
MRERADKRQEDKAANTREELGSEFAFGINADKINDVLEISKNKKSDKKTNQ